MPRSWEDLTPEEMGEAALYHSENTEHPYLYELMEELGINTIDTLQRHIRNYKQYAKVFFGDRNAGTPRHDVAMERVPTPPNPTGFNSPRPTDITHIDPETDQKEWVDWLYANYTSARDLKIMHACDIHFPFQDAAALETFYRAVRKVQPDAIFVGSDSFDFNGIASFIKDPDVKEFDDDDDIIYSVGEYWVLHIKRLKQEAPDAKLIYIWGNHEHRLVRDLITNSPHHRRRLLRDYRDMIRCGSGVWWLGETDYARLGPLIVQHGQRHGINASKNTLKDLGWQVSTMQGHNHTPGIFEVHGEDYNVSSVNSGCLCELNPHYIRGKKTKPNWQHGTVIGMMNMRERDVEFLRPKFRQEPIEGGVLSWTRIGTERIEVRQEKQ